MLRPGGTIAVTVPGWLAEAICWKLSDAYHAPAAAGGHVRIYTLDVLRCLAQAGLEPFATGRAHGLHTPYWWLRCAVGVGDEQHRLGGRLPPAAGADIVRRPLVTSRAADRAMSAVAPKSLVVYARRGVPAGSVTGSLAGTAVEGAADVAAGRASACSAPLSSATPWMPSPAGSCPTG
ncbi:MAG: hypothetical protein R2755_04245 [Acidimicrobiales bacterium]